MRLNPIFKRELRSRQRKIWALVIPFIYAFLLSVVLVITLLGISESVKDGAVSILEKGAGRTLFIFLAFAQVFAFAFAVPSYTAGSITGERDSGTIELLGITLLSPGKVLHGKLLSSLSSILVLLLVALPVAAICFCLGGLSLAEIGMYYLMLLIMTVTYACIGVFFSSICPKSYMAFSLTYLSVGFLGVGCFILAGALGVLLFEVFDLGSGWDFEDVMTWSAVCSPICPVVNIFFEDSPWKTIHVVLFYCLYGLITLVCLRTAHIALRLRYRFR